jgi:hypothetical protein
MRNVLIYDQDKDYIEHLMRQLSMLSEKNYLFTACSTREGLANYTQNSAQWDVLICDMGDETLKSVSSMKLIIPLIEDSSDGSKVGLLKYQCVDDFVERLSELVGVKPTHHHQEATKQIMMVLSAEGGSGKSTFASALAKRGSDQYETLLLSFDVYTDIALMLETNVSKSMTDLFYYIKRQDVGWLKGFQSQLVKDNYLEFTVATPFCSPKDMEELTKVDLDTFFKTLLEDCGFSRIIIEMSTASDQLFRKLLEQVNVVWVVEGNGPFSSTKNARLLEDLQKMNQADRWAIHHVKNTPFLEVGDSVDGSKTDRLPFDQQVRTSFRAKAYSVSGMPYYKALSRLIEGRI